MIENLAVVVEKHGDCVRLSTASPTGCARCDAGEGCGGGVFGKLIASRLRGLELRDPQLNLQTGQFVMLGLEEGVFLRATILTYFFPLLLLLIGAGLLRSLGAADAGVALAGVTGLILGMSLVPLIRRRLVDPSLVPTVLRRAGPADLKACGNV